MKERCPGCGGYTDIDEDAFIWHVLVRRPYVCGDCDARFRPAGFVRAVYFVLGVAGLTGAWFVPRLMEMSKTNPDIKILALSVVLGVTVSSVLVLRLNRRTKLMAGRDRGYGIVHYISYGMPPVALMAFAAAIFLTKQGII